MTDTASSADIGSAAVAFDLRMPPGATAAGELADSAVRRFAGPGVVVLVGLWLCRRILVGSALPAGTDMLDVLARARQNADWARLLSPWSPSGLGAPHQISLDSLLGLLTLVTGDPVRTVKFLMLALFLLTGLSAYWVANRWWGSRLAATLAGVLYMTSQASIGRVASGWIHYEILIALAPLVLYLWLGLLDRFTPVRALTLALLVAALVFARQDMVLWLLPAMAIYVPIRLAAGRDMLPVLRRLAAVVGLVVPVTIALSLYFIVPLYGGVRAPWLSTGQLFQQIRFNLVDRSLDAYQSLLGLGRDLGYLPFNGEEWWNAHPWLPLPLYYEVQGLIVVSAFAAIFFRRDRRTIYLLACAVAAAFLGKGIRGPLGEPYWWGVQHIPVFQSLRGPNRWLIPQAFAYAALAGLTVHSLHLVFSSRVRRGGLSAAPVHAAVVVGALIFLLPVGPTLVSGFRTWQIPRSSVSLMDQVAADRSSFAVASVPYDQSMTFVTTPAYRGWEHDIGVESPLYTDHPTLSTNSWDRRSSEFVDFTSSLLTDRSPSFAALLGSIGVKYLLRFNYPAQTQLVEPGSAGFRQQRALATLPGLSRRAQTPTGALYRLPSVAPVLGFRTNIAVVIGGRRGLAELAALPGVRMADWAAYTADDLVSQGGSLSLLLAMMRTSDLVLFAGASINDVAVLASRPIAELAGITSDPGLDRRYGLLLTDESARQGSFANQAAPPPALATAATRRVRIARSGRYELWTRLLANTDPGSLTFSIDGRPVKTIVPLATRSDFRWVLVKRLALAAGTHTLALAARDSPYGSEFEVEEARLIAPADRARNARLLEKEVAAHASKVAYSLDLSSGPLGSAGGMGLGSGASFWSRQETDGTSTSVDSRHDNALRLTFAGTRHFYTIAQHTFPHPQSWLGRSFLVLRYRRAVAGPPLTLLVDFNRRHTRFASGPLPPGSGGWQSFALPLRTRPGNWGHVVSVRIASESTSASGSIELGSVQLLFPSHFTKTIRLPTRVSAARVREPVRRGATFRIVPGRADATVSATVPTAAGAAGARLVILPASPIPQRAAVPVSYHASPGRYTYSFTARRRGVLVLDQTYDPRWRVTGAGVPRAAMPVTSLVNGFGFGPGRHEGTVYVTGRGLMKLGTVASLVMLVVVLLALALLHVRSRRAGVSEPPSAAMPRVEVEWRDVDRALTIAAAVLLVCAVSFAAGMAVVAAFCLPRRAGWARPAMVGCALVLGAPIWIALGQPAEADRATVATIFAMLIALWRLTARVRAESLP